MATGDAWWSRVASRARASLHGARRPVLLGLFWGYVLLVAATMVYGALHWEALAGFLRGTGSGASAQDIPNHVLLRNLGLGLAAHIGMILAIWRAWNLDVQARVAREGLITERFLKATEQLGDSRPAVRLGAVHSLWRIGLDSSSQQDKRAVLDMLCAFVRSPGELGTGDMPETSRDPDMRPDTNANPDINAPPGSGTGFETDFRAGLGTGSGMGRGTGPGVDPSTGRDSGPDHSPGNGFDSALKRRPRMREDVQTALHLLTRQRRRLRLAGSYPLDFSRADLRRARLEHADLRDADLYKANLSRADLSGADLRGAYFWQTLAEDAVFQGADLRGAHCCAGRFRGARFREADLRGADLTMADCTNAAMVQADLSQTTLARAVFCYADLYEARFRDTNLFLVRLNGADLRRADFSGADLSAASYDPGALEDAITSVETRLGTDDPGPVLSPVSPSAPVSASSMSSDPASPSTSGPGQTREDGIIDAD